MIAWLGDSSPTEDESLCSFSVEQSSLEKIFKEKCVYKNIHLESLL